MAHNSRIRAPSFWTMSSVVTTAEFEAFDLAQFESINGDQGGTWAPAAVITIGGLGLDVTGPFSAGDVTLMTVQSGGSIGVDIGGFISVGGTIELNSGATMPVEGAIELGADGSLTLASGAAMALESGAVCTVESGGIVSIDGTAGLTIGAAGTIACTSGAKITGVITQEARLVKSGVTGRTVWRAVDSTADVAGSFDCIYDVFFYTHTLATNVSHTLYRTGGSQNPADGEMVWFHIDKTSTGNVTFYNEGIPANSIIAVTGSAGTARIGFMYRSGIARWRVIHAWADGCTLTTGALI